MKYAFRYQLELPSVNTPTFTPRFRTELTSGRLVDCDELENDLSAYYCNANYVPIKVLLAWEGFALGPLKGGALIPNNILSTPRTLEKAQLPDIFSLASIVEEISFRLGTRFALYRIVSYAHLEMALAEGKPVLVGGSVYESFLESQDSGVVTNPKPGERLLGGHAFCLVGYDAASKTFEAWANYGISFGHEGYVRIPGSYLRNLNICRDFFVVQKV